MFWTAITSGIDKTVFEDIKGEEVVSENLRELIDHTRLDAATFWCALCLLSLDALIPCID